MRPVLPYKDPTFFGPGAHGCEVGPTFPGTLRGAAVLTPLSAAPTETRVPRPHAQPSCRAGPALAAPRRAGRGELHTRPHGSALTFARLPVGLQREADRAAASHTGGRVLARPVTASIIYCTRLWGAKETDTLSFLRQRPPPLPAHGHLLRQAA